MEGSRKNLNLLWIKARTKNELYRLLTPEASLYLPPRKETSIYFVRDIVQGRKKVSRFLHIFFVQAFYMDEVKPSSFPLIRDWGSKTSSSLLKKRLITEYNISLKITKKLHWINNGLSTYVLYYNIIVSNTFDQENFKLLITKAIKEREESILSKIWMEIVMI